MSSHLMFIAPYLLTVKEADLPAFLSDLEAIDPPLSHLCQTFCHIDEKKTDTLFVVEQNVTRY